ncbi:hypothetical protein BDY17DRAFT_90930 [Neohortaea acidophila]|uniref:Uncharacterized protein n=1 Tax=Neohortaea acidophila TaxID=245834 RepID=A0A6A6PFE0_9PEZI|nr:uncharacterized protein BDY17DRAFT_90930 [Neohortaea acidophila]KAF2478454.1 hypothetical protein BDY17DRAFT_90930 [Neohortaea acidophila]
MRSDFSASSSFTLRMTLTVHSKCMQNDKRTYSHAHIHLLEQKIQHQARALQKMYRMLCESNCWPGPPQVESAVPSVHSILVTLGALNELSNDATPWDSEDDSGATLDALSNSSSDVYFLQDMSSAVDETEAVYFDNTDLLRVDCELSPLQHDEFWARWTPAPSTSGTFSPTRCDSGIFTAGYAPTNTAPHVSPLLTYPDVPETQTTAPSTLQDLDSAGVLHLAWR